MAKILCVLYPDPVSGHPTTYARDGLPLIERYPGGQSVPSPSAIDFRPGELLGDVSGATVAAVAQSVIACVLIDALFILIYLAT